MTRKTNYNIFKITLLAVIMVIPAVAVRADEGICRITGLDISGGRVKVTGDKELNYRLFPLANPDRLVFDFRNSRLAFNKGRLYESEPASDIIGAVRISQFSLDPSVVRLVIEPLTDDPQRVSRASEGTQLIIDIGRDYEPVVEVTKEEASEEESASAGLLPDVPFKVSHMGPDMFSVDIKSPQRDKVVVKQRSHPPRIFIDTGNISENKNLNCLGRISVDSGPVSAYESFMDGDAFRLVLYENAESEYREEALPDGLRVTVTSPQDGIAIKVLSSSDDTEVVEQGVFLFDSEKAAAGTTTEAQPAAEIVAVPPSVPQSPGMKAHPKVKPFTIEAQQMTPDGQVPPMKIDFRMIVGDMKSIHTYGLERVSVGNPEVISVNVISQDELLVTAMKEGQTALMTWEGGGLKQVKWVEVVANVNVPKQQLTDIIGEPDVTANIVGNTIILEGTVDTDIQKSRAEAIATSFGEKVISLIEVLNPQQVMVKVRVVEIDKKSVDDYFHQVSGGSRAESGDFTFAIVSAILDPEIPGGGLVDASVRPGIVNGDIGDIRYDPIDIALDYLETDRKANILSQPNVVALSGQEAKFRVGGEVPYTYQNQDGVNVVEFKEFGVELNMTPNVNSHGGIRLKINPVVRTVDLSLAIAGIPGFRTRTMTTEVQLTNNETIIIGGLIQSEVTETVAKVPLLGDIPVLGELFRSKKFQEDETELLVFLTPVIINTKEDMTGFVLQGMEPGEREEMLENASK